MLMRVAAVLILLLAFLLPVSAQDYHSGSKKAIKLYESAALKFRDRQDAEAEDMLQKAIKADECFVEAYMMLAQICLDSRREQEAAGYFSKALELDPEAPASSYLKLANVEAGYGDFGAALMHLDIYRKKGGGARTDAEAGRLEESCRFAVEAMANPVPFSPENLGTTVNSELMEYWPSLSVDEQILYLTVMVAKDASQPVGPRNVQEDFFYSVKDASGWSQRKNLGAPINTLDNEGAQTITADGTQLFFTACNRKDGLGQCDIYMTRYAKGQWSVPHPLGAPVNSAYSEKHPSVSADGRYLYFASNRPNGKGEYDLWMSTLTEGGWSEPVNLGDSINTIGSEVSPDIHSDNQTLYFASDGWPGMGRSDLFVSRKNPEGQWQKAANLGYPINTTGEDIGLFVDAAGRKAYFASNRREGTDTDIYTFELPEEDRPVPVSYVRGRIYDSGNMKSLDARVQLIDLEKNELVMETSSQKADGEYLVCLPSGRDYAINISRPGYLFYSGNFSLNGINSRQEPMEKDVPLDPVEVGKTVVLNNIFFASDSYELDPRSRAELDKLVEFLLQNPLAVVEISGHTDNIGTPAYNQALSRQRATAVVTYLQASGIPATRLRAMGYGQDKPLAGNESEEGRAQNRRTELTVISNGL